MLAGMGFGGYCGAAAHGAVRWWPPEYLRAPTPAGAAGWFPRRAPEARQRCIEAFCAGERSWRAPVNRHLRDAPVHFVIAGQRIVAVSAYDGTWRSVDGANRGDNLIELGMWRWGCDFGVAARRLAKLAGLRSIPALKPAQ